MNAEVLEVLDNSPQQLFVYGTLKRLWNNHHTYLHGCKYVGSTYQLKGIMLLAGGLPGVNLDEQRNNIQGEIYEVNQAQLTRIDSLESHPHWYVRVQTTIPGFGQVWIYTWPKALIDREWGHGRCRRIVPNGIWDGPKTISLEWGGWGEVPANNVSSGAVVLRGRSSEEVLAQKEFKETVKPTYTSIPRDDLGPDVFSIRNDDTGEVIGPYTFLGEYMLPTGVIKPRYGLFRGRIRNEVRSIMGPHPRPTSISEAVLESVKKNEKESMIGPGSKEA